MKDVNTILQTCYYNALQTLAVDGVSIPVYDSVVPTDKTDTVYVLIVGFNSSDISTKQTSDTNTNIQFQIIEKFDGYISKLRVNAIADFIFKLDPITSDDIQIMRRRLMNDNTITKTDSTTNYQMKAVERTIQFSHKIFHKG